MDIEIIKQTLENNSNRSISSDFVKKLVKSRLSSEINFSNNYSIRERIGPIASSKLPEEKKQQLVDFVQEEAYAAYDLAKKQLNEIFGVEEKKESVETDEGGFADEGGEAEGGEE